MDLNFQLKGAKLQYLPEAPIISNVDAQVKIVHDKVLIDAKNGKILGDDLDYNLEIDMPKHTLYVSGKHRGKVQNILDIAYLHSKANVIKEFSANGEAISSFSFHKSLQRTTTPIEFMKSFNFNSEITNLSVKRAGYEFRDGKFNTSLKMLSSNGRECINR